MAEATGTGMVRTCSEGGRPGYQYREEGGFAAACHTYDEGDENGKARAMALASADADTAIRGSVTESIELGSA